jgi:hypothetical protein
MVIGRDFSGGSSIFEFLVTVPLLLPGSDAGAGLEDAGALFDGGADVFEFEEASIAALLV